MTHHEGKGYGGSSWEDIIAGGARGCEMSVDEMLVYR